MEGYVCDGLVLYRGKNKHKINTGYQSVIIKYDEGEFLIFLSSSRVVNSKHVPVCSLGDCWDNRPKISATAWTAASHWVGSHMTSPMLSITVQKTYISKMWTHIYAHDLIAAVCVVISSARSGTILSASRIQDFNAMLWGDRSLQAPFILNKDF